MANDTREDVIDALSVLAARANEMHGFMRQRNCDFEVKRGCQSAELADAEKLYAFIGRCRAKLDELVLATQRLGLPREP